MIDEIIKAVEEMAGEEYRVMKKTIEKNNGIEMQAVVIQGKEDVYCPTIYLEKLAEDVEKGNMTLQEAVSEIFETYEKAKNPDFEDAGEFLKKEYILKRVRYQVVNARRNAERLKQVPNLQILGLAALYRVKTGKNGSFLITNEIMEKVGINFKELNDAAKKNTLKDGFLIKPLWEIVEEVDKEMAQKEGNTQMYVLTNNSRVNGANSIIFNEPFVTLGDMLKDDLVVIPSSVHELIVMPASTADLEYLTLLLNNMNYTQLAPDEFLSNTLYIYERETKKIRVIA